MEQGKAVDIKQAEKEAVEFYERTETEAATMWRDGLNLLTAGLAPPIRCEDS